jgi:hypothetical protein
MSSSEDPKTPSPKSPFDDQPTTPAGGLKLPSGRAARTDTPLPALDQRYEILDEAGRGGMGIVYKARDRETGELVALKVLKPEIAADASIVERFKNELRLARKITHKNVCRIHDFNRAPDGSAYISMEFVEGESLRNILKRFGNLSLRAGTRITQQICAGLHEAHAQGVVHRDLKPENVMLDRAGNVKIMDFGIARSLEAGVTSTTGIMGTPAYMAPEQAAAKPLDHRADIYALGLILYEMFTGSTAFTGDTPVAVAMKQVHETPPAPRELEPTLPPHVEKAILKCLEKNPAQRFQSVDELEAALTEEVEVKIVQAPSAEAEISVPPQLAVWQRSDWALLASAVLGLALFLVLFRLFHPAPTLEVRLNAYQQKQLAEEALRKLGRKGPVTTPRLFLHSFWYYSASLAAGGGGAHLHDPFDFPATSGRWRGEFELAGEQGKRERGSYALDLRGTVLGILWQPTASLATAENAPAPDSTDMARMKEIAQEAVTSIFDGDVSGIEPLQRAKWVPNVRRWMGEFEWKSPKRLGGLGLSLRATVDGHQVVSLMRQLTGLDFDWQAFEVPNRYFLAGPFMVLFTVILFVKRKVYREPRSPQNLRLAILIGLGGGVAITSTDMPQIGAPGEAAVLTPLVWGALTFSLLTLLSYAVLNTVLHYLRGRFPVQTCNYLRLFREHIFASSAGLEMLRGVFAGAAFAGVWMALQSLAGVWGKALVGMVFWLEPYVEIIGYGFSTFGTRAFPVVVLAEVLLVGWLMVALPLSLLSRATKRWRVLLPALSALWLAFGFSLAGAMVFPTLPYFIFAALQAIFCGVVFLRYGLLATLSAVFTIEVGLLVFPFLTIFQEIDPLPYAIPVVLWCVFLTAAAGICFRPQLGAGYRRVAELFE